MDRWQQRMIDLDDVRLELITGGVGDLVVCSAHPSDDPEVYFRPPAPGAWTYLWDDLMADQRLVLISPRGLGNSSPVKRQRELTFSQLVDDIEAVRTRLGIDRWVFLGDSSGGCIALLYALRYPQSLRGLIIGFSIASGPGFITDPAFTNPVASGFVQLGDSTWITLSHRTMDLTIHMRANLDELGVYDVRDRLGEIRLPTLVISGQHDTTHPSAHGREIHAGIAGSEFLLLEHSGHGVGRGAAPADAAVDRERYLATVRRFLARLAES